MNHLHFQLPKVSPITFLALCYCLLYGFKGWDWSPSKKPNWGFLLQKSWMLHWPPMNASWAEPGYFTRRLIGFIWLPQIPWTLRAWKPFRQTYMCSHYDGALMGMNAPSSHQSKTRKSEVVHKTFLDYLCFPVICRKLDDFPCNARESRWHSLNWPWHAGLTKSQDVHYDLLEWTCTIKTQSSEWLLLQS